MFSNAFNGFQLAFGGAAPKTLNPGQNTQHTSQLKKISESFNGWPTNEPRGTCVCVCVCVCVRAETVYVWDGVWVYADHLSEMSVELQHTLSLSLSLSHTNTHTLKKVYNSVFYHDFQLLRINSFLPCKLTTPFIFLNNIRWIEHQQILPFVLKRGSFCTFTL